MKKILLIPVSLILMGCSNDAAYEWGFKTTYTASCKPERGKEVCECEANKLLENFSQSELNNGDLDKVKVISIIKECEKSD
ncbi:MAG: hypothetical protein CBD86_03025 [Gammaproteobacteria bacterium TMED226]|nr:MAG: hypothetical protein CBD86_03025 [Gammaproteobacteria bacterium TMED226]